MDTGIEASAEANAMRKETKILLGNDTNVFYEKLGWAASLISKQVVISPNIWEIASQRFVENCQLWLVEMLDHVSEFVGRQVREQRMSSGGIVLRVLGWLLHHL